MISSGGKSATTDLTLLAPSLVHFLYCPLSYILKFFPLGRWDILQFSLTSSSLFFSFPEIPLKEKERKDWDPFPAPINHSIQSCKGVVWLPTITHQAMKHLYFQHFHSLLVQGLTLQIHLSHFNILLENPVLGDIRGQEWRRPDPCLTELQAWEDRVGQGLLTPQMALPASTQLSSLPSLWPFSSNS